ncbi:MAG: hypothetical protein U0Y96_12185 [Candidatus Kapaibacterium sp.]
MKYFIVSLALSLLFLNACKDGPVTQTTTIPDNASAFLFNGAVGTVYSYKTTGILVDTNGIETKAGGEIISITITKNISTNSDGRKYLLYSVTGGDTKSFIADENTLCLGNTDASRRYKVYLQKPFTENAEFSRDTISNGSNNMKIIDVNKQITVPAGTFIGIGAVESSYDTVSFPKRITLDKNWYSEGNGVIRGENIRTRTYQSGKKSTETMIIELISITKP